MVKLILCLCLCLLLLPAILNAGNPLPGTTPDPNAKLGNWRWAHDPWTKRTEYFFGESHYSLTDHGIGSYMLFQYFKNNRKMSNKKAFLWLVGCGTAWEIKDGFLPFEKYGKVAGDGFSWKDITKDMMGASTAMLFNWITEKRSKKKPVKHAYNCDGIPLNQLGR